jgi:hypothetical protein
MALLFAAAAVYAGAAIAAGLLEQEVRSGFAFVAIACGGTAYGLWRVRPWARTTATLIAVAQSGLGALLLLSAILDRGKTVGPAVFMGVNVAVAYTLTRDWFA